MSEKVAVGIRVDKVFLKKLERLGREEYLDRSTIMRLLLIEGYINYLKRKAAQEYMQGRITISKAAEKANLSLWEFEKYLIDQGFKSQYSISDLLADIKKLSTHKE